MSIRLTFLFVFLSIFGANSQLVSKCISGNCENGFGTYIWASGNSYTGDFKDGNLNGKGSLHLTSGDSFSGEFKDGLKSGFGIYTWENGEKYIGQYVNNMPEGEGVISLPSGYSINGLFKNNNPTVVKYLDPQQQEISKNQYYDIKKIEIAKLEELKKAKLSRYSINIPEPRTYASMTSRFKIASMQFGNLTDNFFYYWDDQVNIFSAKDGKFIVRSSVENLTKFGLGNEILSDFYKNADNRYDFGSLKLKTLSTHIAVPGKGYTGKTYRIKINNDKLFGINNDSSFTLSLYNLITGKETAIINNFSFWKNKDERKAFFSKEKEDYFNSLMAWYKDKSIIKERRKVFDENSKAMLTNVHASYDSINNIAHIIFSFTHPDRFSLCNSFLYEVDFKNGTYKRVGESNAAATINDDHYFYRTALFQDPVSKNWYTSWKILFFDSNKGSINIDTSYLRKINNLTNPVADVEYITSNKNHIIFRNRNLRAFMEDYYFVNIKNNFCEKIVTIKTSFGGDIVFNDDFSKAGYLKDYKLNETDYDRVTSIYLIDFNSLTSTFIDDHDYQISAINNAKQQAAKDEAKYQAFMAKNAEIQKENDAINRLNAEAKAKRRANCSCCKGTGVIENKGMYLGTKTYTVTTISTGAKEQKEIASYGASSFAECGCCR
jgi:hypothetical protein